jgi:outer membrane beta-barrel protein
MIGNRRFVSVWLVLVLAGWAQAAWAQEEGDSDGDRSVEERLEEQWAPRRGIQIVQPRLYEKVGRHEFTLFGGVIPNDPFLNYYPIGLRYDFYLIESLALEVDGSYIGDTFRSNSELEDFLQQFQANVDLLDQQRWRAHFGINWSPFYGKIAFLGVKLIHFDFSLAAAFGVVGVRSLTEDRLAEEDEFKPEGSLGAGFNFWINNTFSIRVDFRQFVFEKAGGGVSNPSEITLGFSVFL